VRTREGGDLAAAGFQPALVDLRGVCAMAPLARVDLDLPDVDAEDLVELARITLRLAADAPADADYDRETRAWIIDDPGLEVIGEFDRPGAGEFVVGLVVGRRPSFVQVVKAGDRFVLTDGYDRAITLLARGIHEVPAFDPSDKQKSLEFNEWVMAHGMLITNPPFYQVAEGKGDQWVEPGTEVAAVAAPVAAPVAPLSHRPSGDSTATVSGRPPALVCPELNVSRKSRVRVSPGAIMTAADSGSELTRDSPCGCTTHCPSGSQRR